MAYMQVEFWVSTSRMLDRKEIITIPDNLCEDDIKDLLKDWCRKQFDFDYSGSRISYGYSTI